MLAAGSAGAGHVPHPVSPIPMARPVGLLLLWAFVCPTSNTVGFSCGGCGASASANMAPGFFQDGASSEAKFPECG